MGLVNYQKGVFIHWMGINWDILTQIVCQEYQRVISGSE